MNPNYIFQKSNPDPSFFIRDSDIKDKEARISFYTNESEMLRVAEDGFYVRGQKLDIDDKEAASVYKAFREFLIWSALVRE